MDANSTRTSPDERPDARLVVDARNLVQFVVVGDVLLIVLHVDSQWLRFNGDEAIGVSFEGHRLLDLDRETSIPTWWQQALLLAAAALASFIAFLRRRRDESDVRHWTGLGVVFAYLSIDEGAEIHEYLIDPMRSMFDITGGVFYFAWLIPGLAALGAFGLFYLRFWLRLPPRVRWLMAVAGVVFLSGAVGLEMFGGVYRTDSEPDFAYSLLVGAEEALEIVGATIFIASLLRMVPAELPLTLHREPGPRAR